MSKSTLERAYGVTYLRPAPGYTRRKTRLGDETELSVSVTPLTATLTLTSPGVAVLTSVVLTREQLEQHRDAINAVLVATEPGA